ncbi:hypothetical protein ACYCAX_20775 [Pseudomonas sp. MT3]
MKPAYAAKHTILHIPGLRPREWRATVHGVFEFGGHQVLCVHGLFRSLVVKILELAERAISTSRPLQPSHRR